MNATELRERIEALHSDARTASHNHSSELIGFLGSALSAARKEGVTDS